MVKLVCFEVFFFYVFVCFLGVCFWGLLCLLSWLPFGGPCGGFLGVCGLALVSFGFPLGALGRLRAPFGRCWALLGRAFDRFWVASVSLCSFRDGFWVAGVCLGNLCFQQPADHTPGDLPWVGGLIVFKTYYIELLAFNVFF